jgi:LysR family nitrogen assimilation transcriptional regulator
LDLKQLRFFCGVVEAGSFTKAAEFLYIAQPALGLQIRHLEEELGVPLLVRHSRGVTPTEAGQLLYRHAEALLRQFERVRQDMLDFAGEPRGRVCLGLTPTLALALAATLVETCRSRYPGIILNIAEGLSEWLMEWAESDRLDIVLTYNRKQEKGIHAQALAEEVLYFVSPRGVGESKGATVTFDTAIGHDLILPSGPFGLRAMVDEAARRRERQPRIVCEAESVLTIRDLVRRGFGHTILPLGAVRPEVDAGSVVARRITDPELSRTLYLGYSIKRPGSKAITAVCQEIRAAVTKLAAGGQMGWTALSAPTVVAAA